VAGRQPRPDPGIVGPVRRRAAKRMSEVRVWMFNGG